MASRTQATEKLLKLKKRLRCVCGGTSASKTYSILMILIDYAQINKDKKIDVVSESYPHLENGAIKDFKEIMMEHNYWDDNEWNESKHQYSFKTGSVIKFMSVDKIGKSRGPRRDVLFVNEANNIDYEIFDQLKVRTKDIVWADWNPTFEFWYYTEIKDRVDHDFITLTYKDCIDVLDQNIIDDIESHKGNKNWWKVYGLGQLGEIEGRIYTGWRIIQEIPHEARLERYGLDFGYSNDPTALIALYYYNGGYIVDEIIYQKGLHNRDIANIIKNFEKKAITVADSAEPKSIDEIKLYGINIVGAKKKQERFGSTRSFLTWSIGQVQDQRISVTHRSINLLKEYRSYLWQTDDDGVIRGHTPEPGNDHALDAIRYAILSLTPVIRNRELVESMPSFNPTQPKVNPAL